MSIKMVWSLCLVGWVVLVAAPVAEAQPAPGTTMSSNARYGGGRGFRVRTKATAAGKARVELQRLGAGLAAQGAPAKVYEGPPVLTALAVRDDAVLVPLIGGGRQPFVRFAVTKLDAQGAPVGSPTILDATARRQGKDSDPSAVVACPDPQGFTVLWQEQRITAGRADAVTYMVRISPQGTWVQEAQVVQVPWALGAIAYTGATYHLAIFFDGAKPDQTRLCFVTLDAGGRPQQHPWWASRPQLIDEVQLMPISGGVSAHFRGGPQGTSLRSVRVTSIGQWGAQPAPAKDHGAIAMNQDFALRLGSGGVVEVVR
ncbi:MAG: hypothetical protein JRI68_02685 [Deltaproteobacteria bacterium]|nr:hypothetical protein [Deltaproteobacteria bacterium]